MKRNSQRKSSRNIFIRCPENAVSANACLLIKPILPASTTIYDSNGSYSQRCIVLCLLPCGLRVTDALSVRLNLHLFWEDAVC